MTPFLKPRGFWDYGLFALAMTGLLLLLFWGDAIDRLRWNDVLFAATGAVLLVLSIIIMRRGEKAKWIAHPTWRVHLVVTLGLLSLLFGIVYADAYLLHRGENHHFTGGLQRDVIPMAVAIATTLWVSRKRPHSHNQLS